MFVLKFPNNLWVKVGTREGLNGLETMSRRIVLSRQKADFQIVLARMGLKTSNCGCRKMNLSLRRVAFSAYYEISWLGGRSQARITKQKQEDEKVQAKMEEALSSRFFKKHG